jgi:hypothetical protein
MNCPVRFVTMQALMFTTKEKMRQAIVVLPSRMAGRIRDAKQRRWLSRSVLHHSRSPSELIARVLSAAGVSPPEEGLAALRLWGQTGDRPRVWVAAADPVHLEPRLDHLCLNALGGAQSPNPDLRAIFDFLQKSLGEDSRFAFARIGKHGYLRGDEAIATAAVSAPVIDGREPDEYMPAGEDAAAYLTLTSELQMCLHEHEVNLRREAEGLLPVNSVWFWGGGTAPEKKVRLLPPFFGEDPLFHGYWESCTGVIAPWPGNFAECLDFALKDLIVMTPEENDDGDVLARYLDELREHLRKGRLDRLVLLFRDGLTVELGRLDAFRFWRRTSTLL